MLSTSFHPLVTQALPQLNLSSVSRKVEMGVADEIFMTLVEFISSAFMIFGGALPYIPQYLQMRYLMTCYLRNINYRIFDYRSQIMKLKTELVFVLIVNINIISSLFNVL